MIYNGIDVSKWQGKIDWQKVKTDFVFVRIGWANTDGTITEDTYFKTNMLGASAAGIPVGVYLYSYLRTPEAAKVAAANVAEMLRGYKLLMPVVLDIEENDRCKRELQKANTDIVVAALNEWEQRGYYAMYYTYKYFAETALQLDRLTPYDCWIAHYTKKDKTDFSGNFGIWQYSSSGNIMGISGRVDLNKAYRNYPEIITRNNLNRTGTVDIFFDDLTPSQAEEIKTFAAAAKIPFTVGG